MRDNAPDFYLAGLLLPENVRAAINVLYGFHVEITNITWAGGEPLAGEVRLQWWADVIAGKRTDEASGHPLARALLSVVSTFNLPANALEAKLEAHIFELYNDPMGDGSMLEGWCGETRSVLFQMAALILGAEANSKLADASGHAGVTTGVISIIENLARSHAAGKVPVPVDVLEQNGLSCADYLASVGKSHHGVVRDLIDLAEGHYHKAIAAVSQLPQEVRPAFLPLALAPLYLKRSRKNIDQVFNNLAPISQWRRQWALWRGL